MEILKLLDECSVVERYDVLAFKVWHNGIYFKIKSFLKDGSVLFIREYMDETDRNYSYHWQDARASLIIRWDNAPHHPDLPTFPHHRHVGTTIEPSRELNAAAILKTIAAHISPDTEE